MIKRIKKDIKISPRGLRTKVGIIDEYAFALEGGSIVNDFEKACNTENYTGDMTQECVIDWCRGDKEVTVTFAGNTKYCNKVKRYAEEYPNEVKLVAQNRDGSIVAHLPLSWVKITRPRQMSEDQRKAAVKDWLS